ncbi:MAG TPA: response regulator [Flavisolibacter sp.]|nr:response regulator [Flavisolibacter sp.]
MPNNPTKDVLVAEDDLDDFYHFELAVKDVSVPVSLRHATDGDVLFKKLKEAIPDLLFLDIEMPCKNGIACILEIRKDPTYNYMPVIMLTSHNHDKHIEQSYQNGANYYLLKPSTVKALRDKLEMIFSRQWKTELYFPPMNEFVLSE